MGAAATAKRRRQARRRAVRKLLPHADPATVERLIAVDDLAARYAAIIEFARSSGATPATIARCEQARFAVLASTLGGRDAAARRVYDEQPEQPDDRRYRPRTADPLLRGPARATGQTATAVRTGRTVTGWQHEQREQGGAR